MSVGVPTNDRWCSLLSARRERRIHRYTHTWHWGYHETSGMTRGIWTAASNRAALEIQKTKTNGELNGEFIHCKPRVIVMPTLSSLEAPVVVVITTTTGSSIGEKVGIICHSCLTLLVSSYKWYLPWDIDKGVGQGSSGKTKRNTRWAKIMNLSNKHRGHGAKFVVTGGNGGLRCDDNPRCHLPYSKSSSRAPV